MTQITNAYYPNSTDKLFIESNSNYSQNAIINSGVRAFILFSEGYKNASKEIWKNYNGDAGRANTIVYPLVFLNRQFIELRLKEIISGLNYTSNHQYKFSKSHDLLKLWNEFKSLLSDYSESYHIEHEDLVNVGRLIEEFNQIDPASFAFRYPVDNKEEMNPSLKITGLDIEGFINTMEKLYVFFDFQSEIVYALIDQTEDLISAMQSYYESR